MTKRTVRDSVRGKVLVRARNRCERCGVRRESGLQMSHRQARGMGGARSRGLPHDRLSNVNALCEKCHLRFVEARPFLAIEEGWKVPHGIDVLEVPIRMFDGWFLLDDSGARHHYGGLLPSDSR